MVSIKKYLLFFLLVSPLCSNALDNCDSALAITLDKLEYNHKTTTMLASEKKLFPKMTYGFKPALMDQASLIWQPQGITGFKLCNQDYLVTTDHSTPGQSQKYLGLEKALFVDRGARINIIKYSANDNSEYLHVLLLSHKGDILNNLHAGGIAYRSGVLYVTDSRSKPHKLLKFSLKNIKNNPCKEISFRNPESYFNTKYILKASKEYIDLGQTKPDAISYNINEDHFYITKFNKNDPSDFYKVSAITSEIVFMGHLKSQGQGVSRYKNFIMSSHSYGLGAKSRLNISYLHNNELIHIKTHEQATGLEDMYINYNSGILWTLTEFNLHRWIVGFKISDLGVSSTPHLVKLKLSD